MGALLSVVLPVYNGEEYLRESIDSIIAQTYTEWELLILDDCSSDRTAEIGAEYQAMDSRIRYYRNEHNLRLPGNLNKGFRLAKGTYLTWTSDDNRFLPTAFEKMIHALAENTDAQLVFAPYQVIDDKGNPLHIINVKTESKQEVLRGNIVGACFMYTRMAYDTVGDYDQELMLVEDWDYWQRMISRFSFVTIDEVLYEYRWHDGSLTSTKRQEQYGSVLERMLLKNRKLYGKLDMKTACSYYQHLHNSRKLQGKSDSDLCRFYVLKCACFVLNLLERVSRRVVNRG